MQEGVNIMTSFPENERNREMLELIKGGKSPAMERFSDVVAAIDSHNVLAKVFVLEGTPTWSVCPWRECWKS